MKIETVSKTPVGKVIARLPSDRLWVKYLKAGGKAALLRRRLVRGRRIVFDGLEDAVLEGFFEPGSDPEQVLVDTIFTTVSPGTERGYFLDLPNFHQQRPFVPGYSGCGRVKAVGKEVRDIKCGDLVAGALKHQSVSVIAAEDLVPVPPGVDPGEAAFVTLGIIALCGMRASGIRGGETVAVMGQGIIGQIANQLARNAGAGEVIAVARTSRKKGLSLHSGASRFVALKESPELVDIVDADIVIDVSGSSEAIETALKMTRRGGTTILLGSSADYGIESEWPRIVFEKELTVKGAHIRNLEAEGSSYRERAVEFLDLIAAGKVCISSLVTHRFRPDEAPRVYRELAKGNSGIVGAVFEWGKKA